MKIKHPTIPNVSYDVPESAVADWEAQGWEPVKSRAVKPKPPSTPTETPPATA